MRTREICWAAVGVNVGSEIDGKGVSFTRPVLILHVMGAHLALVIPLSTKYKERSGYVPFDWKGQTNALCVHQLKVISQKRLFKRIGKVSENKLKVAKDEVKKFYKL